MNKLILATVAIAAMTFGALPVMADHNRAPRPAVCPSGGGFGGSPYVRSYSSYRSYSPYSVHRYEIQRYSPYHSLYKRGHGSSHSLHGHGHKHGHGSYSPYSRSNLGIHGKHFSFHIGF
jgi:hypothetical protein